MQLHTAVTHRHERTSCEINEVGSEGNSLTLIVTYHYVIYYFLSQHTRTPFSTAGALISRLTPSLAICRASGSTISYDAQEPTTMTTITATFRGHRRLCHYHRSRFSSREANTGACDSFVYDFSPPMPPSNHSPFAIFAFGQRNRPTTKRPGLSQSTSQTSPTIRLSVYL